VLLVISDNGKGFDLANVHPESLGLGIMRDRAKQIDAEFRIDSKIGVGSEVVVKVRNIRTEVQK
jgi:nitrate/nitrite-specific signal transduction histidine kinase